jgi:hypothetical protein
MASCPLTKGLGLMPPVIIQASRSELTYPHADLTIRSATQAREYPRDGQGGATSGVIRRWE